MIRRAKLSDIPGINKLLLQVLQVHNEGRPDLFKPVGQKYTPDELVALINKTVDPIFVYVDDNNNVLGHCFCQHIERTEGPAVYALKTLYIDDLCVDENSRGMHIGKALYDYTKEYAKANGYNNITLHAWAKNPKAVGFYEHLGLEIQQYTFEEVL